METKVRKSIDLDERIFKKLQIEAVIKGLTVKAYIESIINEMCRNKPAAEKIAQSFNQFNLIEK